MPDSTTPSGTPADDIPADGEEFDPIDQPVLNTPYEITRWHWRIGDENRAMPIRDNGRRPSMGLLPVPEEREPDVAQQMLKVRPEDLNETVNAIRVEVARWRDLKYPGATDASKRLLKHWQRPEAHPRLFFAQREAMETLIWLAEVASEKGAGTAAARRLAKKIAAAGADTNDGLGRLAVKMATGTGKTAVMGMLIAWHAVNAAEAHKLPEAQRRRYLTSFVAITPGHTVRERLQSLHLKPQNGDRSIFDEMDLVPAGDRKALGRVQLRVVNFQRFQQKDRLADATGDAKRLLRRGDAGRDLEDRKSMVRRVLKGLRGIDGDPPSRICVINDEAHHCYLPEEGVRGGEDKDDDKAALWFSAIKSLDDERLLGAVYDFSATPMFIQTSERKKSVMFPWVVSDYPLMDAIEAGLVKIPRVPVDDDGRIGEVEWRNLYKNTTPKTVKPDNVPPQLRTAVEALYRNYENKAAAWEEKGLETPPVFIVVAYPVKNATALYHYLGGAWIEGPEEGTWVAKSSEFDLFTNCPDGATWSDHPPLRTLLVHSKLEGDSDIRSSTALGELLKDQAIQLDPYDEHEGSDKEIVREALNTVGKTGELGAGIRCVVSVSMLTEGWDTRTVTDVLGFRAFGTQLLCEQVTGRALRRTTYEDFDDEGRLLPQYANVLGVPFDFMPVGRPGPVPDPPLKRYKVETVPGRVGFRVEFPRLTGYLVEPTGIGVRFDEAKVEPFAAKWEGATVTLLGGVMGVDQTIDAEPEPGTRRQAVVMTVAGRVAGLLHDKFASEAGTPGAEGDDTGWEMPRRLRLFREAVPAVEEWLVHPDVDIPRDDWGWLLVPEVTERAAREVMEVCVPDLERTSAARKVGVFDDDPLGSTEGVDFETSIEHRYPADGAKRPFTRRSEINIAACHSSWEEEVARLLDRHPKVKAWARNFRLGWTVPYEFEAEWHNYEPDFVVRLGGEYRDPAATHLIVEVKGVPDDESEAKTRHVVDWWVPAVRNSPQTPDHLRRWAFVELSDDSRFGEDLDRAIEEALAKAGVDPGDD